MQHPTLCFRLVVLLVCGVLAGAFTATGSPPLYHMAQAQEAAPGLKSPAAEYVPDVRFRLRTTLAEGKIVFVGVGGNIEGVVNPTLQVQEGAVIQVELVNDDGMEHDLVFPDFDAATERIAQKGASSVTVFRADKPGEFAYFCSVPGHRLIGMEGKLLVGVGRPAAPAPALVSLSRSPTDLPGPLPPRGPETVRVELEAREVEGRLADGTSYKFWTFNGRVPGPFMRVRVNDTVEVHMDNHQTSLTIHSVDFHAGTGPGGGAVLTQTPPGEERVFTFQALNPGLYVYHCATPMVAHHVSNGMYGLILVEPEGGLTPVDREFYVMQGELYTQRPFGQQGLQEFSLEKLLNERPEYLLFNGAVGALTREHPLEAHVGETVRIFFGVGGPNYASSFHVIGEIFDRVYHQASLTTSPLTDVQTTLVPAGGAAVLEFRLQVPGLYTLVDHALARVERGLVGFLRVKGTENLDVFRSGPAQ